MKDKINIDEMIKRDKFFERIMKWIIVLMILFVSALLIIRKFYPTGKSILVLSILITWVILCCVPIRLVMKHRAHLESIKKESDGKE